MEHKEQRVTVRMTLDQYESIRAKAETAQMSVSTYMRAAAMRHKIVVIDGLKELTHELRGVGRNLNRLTVLANEGHITAAKLDDTWDTLYGIYERLGSLMEQERS